MTLRVLQDKSEIDNARRELVNMGVSHVDASPNPLRYLMRKVGLDQSVIVGDMVKSWDVHATVTFIQKHLKPQDPVFDMGCFKSEVLAALHKLGYTQLTGADLNPSVARMPYQESIRYVIADFMHTKFADASFKAITSISVMEHGFNGAALLKEVSRLLQPGGYFIASFDYWPAKVDTTGIRFFGMDWTIFSKEEVGKFIADAAAHGLRPVGDMMYDGKNRPIAHGGKEYTFGWLVLTRTA